MRRFITLALAILQLLLPPLARAEVSARRADTEACDIKSLSGWRFLQILYQRLDTLREKARTDGASVLQYDRWLVNEWMLKPELRLEFRARAHQIETSSNVLSTFGGKKHKVLVKRLKDLSGLQVEDAFGKTRTKSEDAHKKFLERISAIQDLLFTALRGDVNLPSNTPRCDLPTTKAPRFWEEFLPASIRAEVLVDDSPKAMRLRRIAQTFTKKIDTYLRRWNEADGDGRNKLLFEAADALRSGNTFDSNVKLEILAWYRRKDPGSKDFVDALTGMLGNRFEREAKKTNHLWVVASIGGGLVLIVASLASLFGAMVLISVAWFKLSGVVGALLLAVSGVVALPAGAAVFYEGLSNIRRDPRTVINPEERRKLTDALERGEKLRLVDPSGLADDEEDDDGSGASDDPAKPKKSIIYQ